MKKALLALTMTLFFSTSVCLAQTATTEATQAAPQTDQGTTGSFAKPTYVDVVNALIRFGAISIKQDSFIDDYTFLNACKEFHAQFSNEFRWQSVRKMMRQRIRDNVASFPTGFYYDGVVYLDRYDFKEHMFRFVEASAIRNVNAFRIYSSREATCDDIKITYLPKDYRVVLDKPVFVLGLPLSEGDSEALIARMSAQKNTSRTLYVRFNLRLFYIAPLTLTTSDTKAFYVQEVRGKLDREKSVDPVIRMDARLDSVDFYEDPERTRLIYSYQEGGVM